MPGHFEKMAKLLGITPSRDQVIFARYLEAHGRHFCVHWGVKNVEEKALEHCVNRMEAQFADAERRQ